jgi:hypothetical protein
MGDDHPDNLNFMSSITEKVENAISSLIGRPTPKKSPTENAALVICELAVPRIKSAMGGRYAETKKLFENIERIQHTINFEITENAAHAAYQKQLDEHAGIATSGGDLPAVTRGRSRTAWVSDYEARREAASQSVIKLMNKFKPLQTEIGDLILAQLHDDISELENSEAKLAAKFGLPYRSSATVATLRGISDYLRNIGTVTVLKNF